MKSGNIGVAECDGVNVIKMSGDVRLTLCLSFDDYISNMFQQSNFKSVVFDLTQAEAIDSTTLGLMAKISILSQKKALPAPTIVSPDPSIKRLLDCMGFSEIFTIVDDLQGMLKPQSNLECGEVNEEDAKLRVIEAHKILMDLNEKNADTFKDLVNTLEAS